MLEQFANALGLPSMESSPQTLLPRQRIERVLNGELPDRTPVCFWHHFQPAGSGRELASQTIEFFVDEFDLDIVKVMPDLPYPFPYKSIKSVGDWRMIEAIDPERSSWVQQQIACVESLSSDLMLSHPIVVTMFSPLTEMLHFAQDTAQLLEHVQQAPAVVHQALATIAENQRRTAERLIQAGADGLFFALQGASTAIMPEATYREIGMPYDLMALRGAQGGWLNILHLHGDKELMFDMVLGYPVHVLNWSDRIAGPSLREARMKTSLGLMGGWNERGAITSGNIVEIQAEALDAFEQTNGMKFILAPGCSLPDDTAPESMDAARESAESLYSDEFVDDDDAEEEVDGEG